MLEGNTKALENLYDLMIKMSTPAPAFEVKEGYTEPEPVKAVDPISEPLKIELTVEYCRKALKAVRTKMNDADTRGFLESVGGAKTIPDLKPEYYEDFIAQATAIMKGE